ncbi:MAG: ATP-NAD kinase family protein [Gammaproteobacteria bacterium]|nr:ATP-NAD kinase family protein [Gammaproteobacteria bacterium]MCW8923460.1 ATP-NAD kinase family protein [Gammaproteobacteria bacterium]
MKLGLIINPMAGIGGRVGLKGSDGREIVDQALAQGAQPGAGARTLLALQKLADVIKQPVLTVTGVMGADVLERAGIAHEIVMQTGRDTTASDTRDAVLKLCEKNIDLLLFAGGDGTARNVLDALNETGQAESLPVVGIPSGCKIHSAVYAVTPSQAGELVALLEQGAPLVVKPAEVMDLDEQAYREGEVSTSCYGYLLVPVDDIRMQAMKQGGLNHEEMALQDIAADVVEHMEDNVLYFIGAGTTTAAVMDELGLENSLLGIDVVLNRELVASDVDEKAMLDLLADNPDKIAKIIVTAIGGQGHIFGRGNQQFSPIVIAKVGSRNIIVIATNEKLRSLQGRPLLLDTGSAELDKKLSGMKQIVTGFEQRTLYKLS